MGNPRIESMYLFNFLLKMVMVMSFQPSICDRLPGRSTSPQAMNSSLDPNMIEKMFAYADSDGSGLITQEIWNKNVGREEGNQSMGGGDEMGVDCCCLFVFGVA